METKKLTIAQEIASIIRQQLGGSGVLRGGLGAYDIFCGSDEKHAGYLCFKFKMCKNFNYIKIALNGKDLYDVTFLKIWGMKTKNETIFEDIYVEDLQELFEKQTGLYLKII